MKVFRQRIAIPSGHLIYAYVRANPLERLILDRMMRSGRHNLRPAHNWAGPRKYRASYILKPKGRPNPDMGPDLKQISHVRRFFTLDAFTWFDMVSLMIPSALYAEGFKIPALILGTILAGTSLYIKHQLRKLTYVAG